MRAALTETAFEQDELMDVPRIGAQTAMPFQESVDTVRSAIPAREGDVGPIGPLFGLDAGGLAGALDLGSKDLELLLWMNAGP